MIYIITTLKKAIISSILIILLCIVTPILSQTIYPKAAIGSTLNNKTILFFLEIYVIIVSAVLSLITFFYLLEFIKIETKHNLFITFNNNRNLENLIDEQDNIKVKSLDSVETNKLLSETNNSEDDLEKFKKIYEDIISFYEKTKPYQEPDFTIKKLSTAIDSNETYVSIALNKIGNYNFSTLTNKYRIEQVLEEFKLKNHLKYTVINIYSRAGFNHQSTFNRIFKKHTGSSPTAYIEKLNKNLNI